MPRGGPIARPFVPHELLVRFGGPNLQRSLKAVSAVDGAAVEKQLPVAGLRLLDLPSGVSVQAAARRLESQPGVSYAEPNFYRSLDAIPNDPRFARQWSLHNTGQKVLGYGGTSDADIDAPGSWDTTTGSSSVTVAVADDGVDYTHPDLAGNIWKNPGETGGGKQSNGIDDDGNGYVDDWRGWDFADEDNNPYPSGLDSSHGTNVAGVIGASGNNGTGIAGVNWQAGLMPLRIFAADGSATVADEINAFGYAAGNGANVVNASFGGPGYSQAESDAIADASNVLFVAAAGNDGHNSYTHGDYPCNYSLANIICVAATDQSDRLTEFSNFGPTNVDLAAPGLRILSTHPAGKNSSDLFEDFETETISGWLTGGRGKHWGITNRLPPNLTVADSPYGKYRSNTNSWVRTPAIDFRGRRLCQVDFYLFLRTEWRHDYLYVESSGDARHWNRRRSYTGRRNGYTYAFLPSSLNGDPSVYVRWRLKSDGIVNKDGAYVDDVGVTCVTTKSSYGLNDGTSFSVPEVAGTAALVWANSPTDSVADVRNAILGTVDAKGGLSGRVATGGRLNAASAVAAP
jgi:subtilisin family serine protease